ncbi:hypothetical protein MNEG_2854 [Monoraphidium neglectum]|uniref:Uncharacterized protein n=1 Tax=Monoraphidium neglectum TaxID=145388 RepID=A0A0D2MXK2_9CHLO|nr:hypothetical protein MNEG_2854 [Monoraphidium neglectum]KIZ05107.1 hypothetical protein MNEG_2854 [Monoraphidium neglectum]|eukprot:XP_013904126.1 hypothetical protein MNEG_2854 [Monoraphidium neglectum]
MEAACCVLEAAAAGCLEEGERPALEGMLQHVRAQLAVMAEAGAEHSCAAYRGEDDDDDVRILQDDGSWRVWRTAAAAQAALADAACVGADNEGDDWEGDAWEREGCGDEGSGG